MRFAAGVCIGYVLLIAAAEATFAFAAPLGGTVIHVLLLIVLPVHAAFVGETRRPFLVSLALVPLLRVVSVALPLASLPLDGWHALAGVPLFIAAFRVIRVLGLRPREIGLTLDDLPLQLAIGVSGLALAAWQQTLNPVALLPPAPRADPLTLVVIYLVFVGLLEELMFRGILQATSRRALGPVGPWLVSVVFALLHIGNGSFVDVLFALAVGVAFSWLVWRTGSIVGVSLAHGLAAVATYLPVDVTILGS
ncbi:MAG: type II CAAX endopeptidase family protein [Chloroflexota bacterium]